MPVAVPAVPAPAAPANGCTAAPPDAITVPASAAHTATVIFIHGLGDTGAGWQPVVDLLRADPQLSHVRWVLPHSPSRPLTANMSIPTPSWFDIVSFGFSAPEDESGMLASAASLDALIAAEPVPPSRIVLVGFSMGGAMALIVGLTRPRRVAAVGVLSGWLPLKHKFASMAAPHASSIPVFWGHGAQDPLIKPTHVTESVDLLTSQIGAHALQFRRYDDVGHTTCPQELEDLREWIKIQIPQQ